MEFLLLFLKYSISITAVLGYFQTVHATEWGRSFEVDPPLESWHVMTTTFGDETIKFKIPILHDFEMSISEQVIEYCSKNRSVPGLEMQYLEYGVILIRSDDQEQTAEIEKCIEEARELAASGNPEFTDYTYHEYERDGRKYIDIDLPTYMGHPLCHLKMRYIMTPDVIYILSTKTFGGVISHHDWLVSSLEIAR